MEENPENKILTYEETLNKIGGFGRYQYFVTITLTLGFMSGGFIVYGLPFLEKYPDYECLNMKTNVWYQCDR